MHRITPILLLVAITTILNGCKTKFADSKDWKPAENTMLTPWGEKLDPDHVWQEYPRPAASRINHILN